MAKIEATIFEHLKEPAAPVRKGRGRPRWEPDAQQRKIVLMMAGFKVPHELIAEAFGITKKTLYKACKREIARGSSMVYAQLCSNMLALSQLPNGVGLKATEGLLQMRFGWSKYAPPPDPRPVKEPAKGKKVIEDEQAHAISGGWARALEDDPDDANRIPN